MAQVEIYVIDPVKAALWWGGIVSPGQVLSVADDTCPDNVANCQKCGHLHGVAPPAVLEARGLAARRVSD